MSGRGWQKVKLQREIEKSRAASQRQQKAIGGAILARDCPATQCLTQNPTGRRQSAKSSMSSQRRLQMRNEAQPSLRLSE